MNWDYTKVKSMTEAEFTASAPDTSGVVFNTADDAEVAKVEKFLDLSPGILSGDTYKIEDQTCPSCSKKSSFFDFVFTAVVDGGHPKSFIVHTLVGSKLLRNQKQRMRCSNCMSLYPLEGFYEMRRSYGCSKK